MLLVEVKKANIKKDAERVAIKQQQQNKPEKSEKSKCTEKQ